MKFTPSFRLVLFFFALPFFGYAQQFPVNNQKIVQGVGTTAQGISSYSSSPPTVAPTASTFRHVTSLHMDTVLQVQYIYKRPRWYPISTVRRATPPPATASSGSTTIDYTESLWQNTADSLTYYYEEENACWQPIGTYISSTTPADVAATGSTGAICYGYGLWYDPDIDSIYAQQGATWTAIGAGGGGGSFNDWTAAADSGTPAVIGDGETVTIAGGYGVNTAISGNTVTAAVDTAQVATPYDLSLKTWLKPEIESGNYVSINGANDSGVGLGIEEVGEVFLQVNGNTGSNSDDAAYMYVYDYDESAMVELEADNRTKGVSRLQMGHNKQTYDAVGDTAVINILHTINNGATLTHRLAFFKGKEMIINANAIEIGRLRGGGAAAKVTINSDTLIVSGLYPVGASGDSVLVRDATTKRIELRAQSDISGGGGGISGLTTNRIPYASSSTSIADGFLLQSAAGLTLDANLSFRLTGGTTASRPTGAAGMQYWNTSNGWLDIHNGTSWFNPLRSATATGLGTSQRVGYFDVNGAMTGSANFLFNGTDVSIGGAPFNYQLNMYGGAFAYICMQNSSSGTSGSDGFQIGYETAGTYFINRENAPMGFFTNGTEKIRLSAAGLVGIGTTSPDRLLHPELSGSATNTVGLPLRLSHITSGTATTGFGTGMEFEAENASGTNRVIGQQEAVYTTATNAAEVSDLVFRTMRAGTLTEALRSKGDGTLRPATLTGTATKIVGATSDNTLTSIAATITTAGTTGNVTINALAGTVNIAAAGTTVTVTNSNVTANSLVFCTLRTNDATATVKNVVPAAGSFVVNLGAAATGEVSIGFFVVN